MLSRSPAKRAFAMEIAESNLSVEKDGVKYILSPLGDIYNRVFFVGTLLEKDEIKKESGIWGARIADQTGAFICFIGNFQPEALESLHSIEPPALVAVSAKVRTYERDDRTRVAVRPEFIVEVDKDVRDKWISETAIQTIRRLKKMQNNKDDEYVSLAWKHYNPDLEGYKNLLKIVLEDLHDSLPVEFKEEVITLDDLIG